MKLRILENMMSDNKLDMNRRAFIKNISALGITLSLYPDFTFAKQAKAIKKAIPSSGELLPVIGMGSSRTFDVGDNSGERDRLTKVLQTFFDYGGSLIDSSPMYGTSEAVIGDLLKEVNNKSNLFVATKVWTYGKEEGITQMERSMKRMEVKVFDLMQIHNLRDWQVHLETLQEWKANGKVRYIGITTSHGRYHDELEVVLESEKLDFVQFSYNIGNRDIEKRLLPLAADRGMATLINRPYQRGDLFRAVKGKPLPNWASEFDCKSWGQFFLKFIVSHPDVTCAIPATSKVHHMTDNMTAGFGRLPDTKIRKKMIQYMASLN